MDYPHFSVNFVNFGIHKLSTLITMWPHSCVQAAGVVAVRRPRRTALPNHPAGGMHCRNPPWLLPASTSTSDFPFAPPKNKLKNKNKNWKYANSLVCQFTSQSVIYCMVLPFYLSLSSKHDFHSGGSLCSTPTRQSQHTWGNCLASSSQFSHYWE